MGVIFRSLFCYNFMNFLDAEFGAISFLLSSIISVVQEFSFWVIFTKSRNNQFFERTEHPIKNIQVKISNKKPNYSF